jgi:hypothetical protein
MNDEKSIFLIMIALLMAFMLFYFFGVYRENKRIYDNCLLNNGELVHNEAKKICYEVIK